MFQLTRQRDVAVGYAPAVKLFEMQCAHQKWIQIDARNRNFSLQRIRIGHPQRQLARNSSGGHRRTEEQLRCTPVGSQASIEASDHVLSDPEIHYSKSPVTLQRG